MFENGKIVVFKGKCRRFRILANVQSLTAPRIISRFGRKMCQKKPKEVSYQLLWEFAQKYFVVHELWAGKNSFSTYISVLYLGCFILVGIVDCQKRRPFVYGIVSSTIMAKASVKRRKRRHRKEQLRHSSEAAAAKRTIFHMYMYTFFIDSLLKSQMQMRQL